LLLPYQNSDGGWASYEKTRAPQWLERLNPSRIFGEIMVDYSYVECTSACLQGIQTYIKYKPNTATVQLQAVIDRGVNFILSKQQESGLWYGSWAVCFTYGTWFAVEALVQCKGLKYERLQKQNPITKACDALVSVQREDGSWGESYQACIQKKYVQHQEGQVINTAWAIMTLLAANYDDVRVIDRAINFLMEKQEPTGDWPQQGISGVFNHNCMITYVNYRNIFPLWALQRYENVISNGINA
jgi:squalene/oxidosqualene cyclase-like protein